MNCVAMVKPVVEKGDSRSALELLEVHHYQLISQWIQVQALIALLHTSTYRDQRWMMIIVPSYEHLE